jgi:hypothetical protein
VRRNSNRRHNNLLRSSLQRSHPVVVQSGC